MFVVCINVCKVGQLNSLFIITAYMDFKFQISIKMKHFEPHIASALIKGRSLGDLEVQT